MAPEEYFSIDLICNTERDRVQPQKESSIPFADGEFAGIRFRKAEEDITSYQLHSFFADQRDETQAHNCMATFQSSIYVDSWKQVNDNVNE